MKHKRITVTTGIPASGKSTWAKEQVLKGKGATVRVNKDDLRGMVHVGKFSRDREKLTLAARDKLVETFLRDSKITNVIVDDTNLHPKHFKRMEEIADYVSNNVRDVSVKVYREWFDDSLDAELCHKRNITREATVPHTVIEDMYAQYVKLRAFQWPLINEEGKPAVIFDIDGTLADHTGLRSPFDWENVGLDRVRRNVAEYALVLRNTKKVILLSGRDGSCRVETEDWLAENGIKYDKLFMREAGDCRKDWIIKRELYEEFILPNYRVDLVVDDRTQVVRMWRALGLECWQVQPGNF